MKASMKITLYKVLVVLDSSGNVSNSACTCPAGTVLRDFGNCNFVLEDFDRKGEREKHHVDKSYLLGMFLHFLLLLLPLMKLFYRKSNMVQIVLGDISPGATH